MSARSTPGCPSVATGAPLPERMALPMKKQEKVKTSDTTRERTPITIALAARSRGLRGVAAREARMVPLAYSPVMVSMLSTPDGQ